MTLHIIGAGQAGLLAGNMLRHYQPEIFEKQSQLPNNHSAVLRFKSSIVGDVLNIPFKEVTLIKDDLPWLNPVADALMYSFKNTGTYRSDRSIVAGMRVTQRWIAPQNLIARMAERCDIAYGHDYSFRSGDSPIVSTIPMPTLMQTLLYPGYDVSKFHHVSGYNVRATIANCDAYVSLLIPSPHYAFSRLSITGDELIIEMPRFDSPPNGNGLVDLAARLLGIHEGEFSNIQVFPQQYAKILPIDEDARRAFLFWATDNFNIFSLGRYACWRPKLELDDLVQDLRLIDRWISSGRYAVAKHR